MLKIEFTLFCLKSRRAALMCIMSQADYHAKIMIIDDQPLNLRLASTVLNAKGYETKCLSESTQAAEQILAYAPDLILLDIMMPDLDGISLCKLLKSNPATALIPIIFITAKTGSESLITAFDAGAVDFVCKPFESAELLARVKTHVQIRVLQKNLSETISNLEQKQRELIASAKQIQELKSAMVKICAWTKQIQIDGKWISIEEYFTSHLGLQLTHGVSDSAAKEILKAL